MKLVKYFSFLMFLIVTLLIGTTSVVQAHQNQSNTCYHPSDAYVECCGANYCSGLDLVNDCSTYYYSGTSGYPTDYADHTYSSSRVDNHESNSSQCQPSCTAHACDAPEPACGQTTFGTQCDGTTETTCSKTGPACPLAVTIGGRITNSVTSAGISGISVTIQNAAGTQQLVSTNSNGDFSKSDFVYSGEAYAVRAPNPLTGYSLRTPTTQYENQVAGSSPNCGTSCNFAYTPQTFTIGGTVTKSTGGALAGVIINSGVTSPPGCNIGTATTDASGNYRFNNVLYNLSFCLRPPSVSGYTGISPTSYESQTATANKTDYNFSYTAAVLRQLTVSCSVTPTSTATNTNVTWTANVSAGTSPYTYSWSGTDSLQGKTVNPATVSYTTAGTKTGSVTVTDSSSPAQSVTSINTCSVTITALPDLVVDPIIISPTSPVKDNTVTFSTIVRNLGGTAAAQSTTRLSYKQSAETTWATLGTDQTTGILAINGNETETWSNAWTVPSVTADTTYNFKVCADATSVVSESDETNNCTSRDITVTRSGSTTTPLPGAFSQTASFPAAGCNGTSPYVDLSWTSSTNATSYEVYRNSSFLTGGLTQLNYRDSTVSPSTSYTYVIRARNSIGFIDSNSRSATTLSCSSGSTPSPSSGCAWIQTTGGDVHSNTGINTPCGP